MSVTPTIEKTILKNLLRNDDYAKKVLPFIKPEYFQNISDKLTFEKISEYINTYQVLPDKTSVKLEIDKVKSVKQEVINQAFDIIDDCFTDTSVEKIDWLIDNTEEFCKQKALYNAMASSLELMNSKKSQYALGNIPQTISDALAVSFDPNVGHDYLESSDDRYNNMHKIDAKIPCDIDMFNKITRGGVSESTLNMFFAPPGVGKSLVLCHLASSYLLQGKNVLYITLEMSEQKIAERIDANLLNLDMDILEQIPKTDYDRKIASLRTKTTGKLIIKEYPTSSASVVHFRALLHELFLKKNFVPDIICVDYLNICTSSRLTLSAGSYSFIKAIAEELRGLGQEFRVPIWSATQTNRGGIGSSDLEMSDLSESIGTGMTVDLLIGIVATEELIKLNQFMFVQAKNRYADVNSFRRFVVGVDRPKMKLYNVLNSAQPIVPTPQAIPASGKSKFGGFKV